MGRNGQHRPARPRIELGPAARGPSPEEAAAITAAIEQFMRDTAPPPAAARPARASWQRAALLEGTGSGPLRPTPWGDAVRWGA